MKKKKAKNPPVIPLIQGWGVGTQPQTPNTLYYLMLLLLMTKTTLPSTYLFRESHVIKSTSKQNNKQNLLTASSDSF